MTEVADEQKCAGFPGVCRERIGAELDSSAQVGIKAGVGGGQIFANELRVVWSADLDVVDVLERVQLKTQSAQIFENCPNSRGGSPSEDAPGHCLEVHIVLKKRSKDVAVPVGILGHLCIFQLNHIDLVMMNQSRQQPV